MSILGTKYFKKQTIVYLLIAVFCLIFSKIYALYSHGVSSFYMTYLCLIPFVFGALPSLISFLLNKEIKRISINLYNASVATFTLYSLLRGVLEIYGTTNRLINIYLIVGIILLLLSIIFVKKNRLDSRN